MLTEAEAKTAITANGYRVVQEAERAVTVSEPGRGSQARFWHGVNFLDLAQSFRLHQRPAKKPRRSRITGAQTDG